MPECDDCFYSEFRAMVNNTHEIITTASTANEGKCREKKWSPLSV